MSTEQPWGFPASRSPAAYLIVSLAAFSNSAVAGGDLVWHDAFGSQALGDSARAVAISGNIVFAAGFIQTAAPGVSPFAVRAYTVNTGELLWAADQPSSDSSEDTAHDVVAANGEVVIVCGRLDDRFGVVAYDRHDGDMLWEDRAGTGRARACSAHGRNVFVVGSSRNDVTGSDVLVRAYDARTGVLLWEDQVDGGAQVADAATDLSIADGRLFVVGGIQPTPGDDDMLIRRYDAETGALVWHQVFAGPVGERDEATAVAAKENRVFVAGRVSTVPESFGNEWAVHARDAATGELLWTDHREQEEVHAITVSAKHVLAAGGREDGTAVVRAYDGESGDRSWEDTVGSSASVALAVDTGGQRAYWGGQSRGSPDGATAFTVRAVDLKTGEKVWQDLFGSQSEGGRVNDLIVASNRVVAVGHTTVGFGTADFLVRVYKAR